MIQFIKKASLSLMVLMLACVPAPAGNNAAKSTNTSAFNWNPVMDAIIQVESGGNTKAVSGKSVGAMQITPILVKDCNIILKKRNSKLRYTLADRYSLEKSKEMFLLIQSYHNPENSIEKAIRAWNGGPKYSVRATNRYFKKVMSKMK
ncbi:MAG: lytic transglycosylase domain-containing protein [Prevotella sp.]|nr:lytic transglycosylase domain-containing protein [Prevotella sp.]